MGLSIKNHYFFTTSNIIFKIADSNPSNDECGKHYMIFDTEEKPLSRGTKYYDKNENLVTANDDGELKEDGKYYYQVKTDHAYGDEALNANKAVFPYFKIKYNSEKNGQTIQTDAYFWLDDLISVGDKMTNGAFVNKTIHANGEDSEMTYLEYYTYETKQRIKQDIVNGATKEDLVQRYPLFFKGSTTIFDGVPAQITETAMQITDEVIIEIIKQKIKEYGDGLLEQFGKTCSVSVS